MINVPNLRQGVGESEDFNFSIETTHVIPYCYVAYQYIENYICMVEPQTSSIATSSKSNQQVIPKPGTAKSSIRSRETNTEYIGT